MSQAVFVVNRPNRVSIYFYNFYLVLLINVIGIMAKCKEITATNSSADCDACLVSANALFVAGVC